MSISTTAPLLKAYVSLFSSRSASCALLFGLNPNELSKKIGSKILSRILLIADSTILSSKQDITNGLLLPSSLGMKVILAGLGWYFPRRILVRRV